jgi:hypothetical protein
MISDPARPALFQRKGCGLFWNDDAVRWLVPHQQSNMAE